MARQNCWEFKKCGRQPGGVNVSKLGVCPACIEEKLDKQNEGRNGGRSCWVICGTLCGGEVQGTFAAKIKNCFKCDFYQIVQDEEKADFVPASELLKKLK